ncbi:hypothetical protein PR048_000996 [Dryococelus australis]|uniref:Helix-turn-helix domain-containing protein n=1 Tax=Dryococelus australis TaxID=614101 RepID=A0ABQ9IHL7_9NEOP|nr:hypothetical protein PR048_000996 [Dryococelus australis]
MSPICQWLVDKETCVGVKIQAPGVRGGQIYSLFVSQRPKNHYAVTPYLKKPIPKKEGEEILLDREIPSGAAVAHWIERFKWGCSGSVDREIPSGAIVSQLIERFQDPETTLPLPMDSTHPGGAQQTRPLRAVTAEVDAELEPRQNPQPVVLLLQIWLSEHQTLCRPWCEVDKLQSDLRGANKEGGSGNMVDACSRGWEQSCCHPLLGNIGPVRLPRNPGYTIQRYVWHRCRDISHGFHTAHRCRDRHGIVYNVAIHLKEQKRLHNLKYNIAKATSAATGVSQITVKRIVAEVDQWKKCYDHVINIEAKYFKNDAIVDIKIDKIIVNLDISCDENSSGDTGNKGGVTTPTAPNRFLGTSSCSVEVQFLCFLLLIPGGVAPTFSPVGIVPDNATGRRVFSGVSHFLLPCIPALFYAYLDSSSLVLKTSLLPYKDTIGDNENMADTKVIQSVTRTVLNRPEKAENVPDTAQVVTEILCITSEGAIEANTPTSTEDCLIHCLNNLNAHSSLKFTWTYSKTHTIVLDVELTLHNGVVQTAVHTIPINSLWFLHFDSYHPYHAKNSLPYSLVTRAKHICSINNDLNKQCEQNNQSIPRQGLPQLPRPQTDSASHLKYQNTNQCHQL